MDERGLSFPSSPLEEVETNLPVAPKVSTFFEFKVFGYFIAKNGRKQTKIRAFREYFTPILSIFLIYSICIYLIFSTLI